MPATITLKQNTATAESGEFIYMSGVEFGLAKQVSVFIGGARAGEFVTDMQGSFEGQVQVPREVPAGSHRIVAKDPTVSDDAAFTIS